MAWFYLYKVLENENQSIVTEGRLVIVLGRRDYKEIQGNLGG